MRYNKIDFKDVYPKTGDCRYCHGQLTGKQTSWCSKRCYGLAWDAIMALRGSSKYMRKLLKKRDKEICSKCGRDCELTKRIIDHAGFSAMHYEWNHQLPIDYYILRYFGFMPHSHSWEADHIIAVKDGGTHELSNLQTLCIPCHKEKTNEGKKMSCMPRNWGS